MTMNRAPSIVCYNGSIRRQILCGVPYMNRLFIAVSGRKGLYILFKRKKLSLLYKLYCLWCKSTCVSCPLPTVHLRCKPIPPDGFAFSFLVR